MSLELHINRFFQEKNIPRNANFVVGVSGGADSVACLLALHELGHTVIAAHVNYQLRGVESDEDEDFVRKLCKKNQITYAVEKNDCKEYCEKHNLSIQEGAREIRYAFFKDIKTKLQADYIVTAHHKSDQAETVLLNLIRGTGSRGLSGIPETRSSILRPLLDASKEEILHFLKEKNQDFRTDSSNNKNDYSRNFLRNEVIPLVEKKFPKAIDQITKTAKNIDSDAHLLERLINEKLPIQLETSFRLNKNFFTDSNFSLIRHQLSKLGFSDTQVKNMIDSDKTGVTFESNTHQCISSKEDYLFSIKKTSIKFKEVSFANLEHLQYSSFFKEITLELHQSEIRNNSCIAQLDFDKIKFPLTIRNWKHGDRFQPIGMKGTKKVSDFLNDLKINRLEKEKVKVLTSANEIIWVIGYRMAESVKISKTSKKTLILVTKDC